MRNQFEAGDTVQFTLTTSVAPDELPRFALFGPNSGELLSNSQTAQASNTLSFYALVTMPGSADGVYLCEWLAHKTAGGTQYPFVKRFLINVAKTVVQP